MMSPNWRWAAMAWIACVIGGGSAALAQLNQMDNAARLEEQKRRQHNADWLIHEGRGFLLEQAVYQATIILVRVVELEGPSMSDDIETKRAILIREFWGVGHNIDPVGSGSATVKVLKSWKGPFPAGRVLRVEPATKCAGNCDFYQFQAGDKELLILTHSTQEPIHALADLVMPVAESQALMRALDQAVEEGSPPALGPG